MKFIYIGRFHFTYIYIRSIDCTLRSSLKANDNKIALTNPSTTHPQSVQQQFNQMAATSS